MQFVSFLMSMVMMIAGLLVAPEQDTSQKVQAVDSAVSALFGKSESLFEEETGAIVEAIVKNILIDNSSGNGSCHFAGSHKKQFSHTILSPIYFNKLPTYHRETGNCDVI